MDFDLTEEHKLARQAAKDFAKKEIEPLVEDADLKEEFPKQLFPMMGKLGYLGITCPEKYGGAGGDTITECIVLEEIAYFSTGIAGPPNVHSNSIFYLTQEASEKQKKRYIPPALRGEEIWASARTEPDAGSDRSMYKTNFRENGDHFILNGSKIYVTNAPFADHFIVEGYTDMTKGAKGMSRFVLDKGTPGFEVIKLSKFGMRAHEQGQLFFDNCVVLKENQLGEEGWSPELARRQRPRGWIMLAIQSIGVAQAAFDAALKHAKTRIQFGRPIGLFQANSFKLAEMALEIESARLLTYRAAWLRDKGRDCFKEASMAKLHATEMAVRVTGQALQIHGAQGCFMGSLPQMYFRDARLRTIPEQSSELQHILIAREFGLRGDDLGKDFA